MGEQEIEPFAYQKSTNIDEHNQIVDKVNEIVDVINGVELDEVNNKIAALQSAVATNTTDIATNASDIDSLADTVDAQATSIATNKDNIESLRDANIIITKDIESIKETDTEQNASITALDNADIATATSEFDNTARKLTITLNPKSGDAITTETIIPGGGESADVTGTAPIVVTDNNVALNINSSTLKVDDNGQLTVIGGGGGGGGDYSATLPITIADNAIGIAYDDTLALKDNKLSVVNTGTDYVAGTGITINDATIAVDETVIATKESVDSMGITVSGHTSDIASLEQKYDSQSTAITELSTDVSNAISTANSANAIATEVATDIRGCYNNVSIANNVMTFDTVDGKSDTITLPSGGTATITTYANTNNAGGIWQRCLGLKEGDEFYFKCACNSTVTNTIGGTIHAMVVANDGVSISAMGVGSVYYSKTKGSYLGPVPIGNAKGSSNSNMILDQTGLYVELLTAGDTVASYNFTEWSGGIVITIKH